VVVAQEKYAPAVTVVVGAEANTWTGVLDLKQNP
jgi:hypothetical protein